MKVTQLPLHIGLEEEAKAYVTQAALEALHGYRVGVTLTQLSTETLWGRGVGAIFTQLAVEVVRSPEEFPSSRISQAPAEALLRRQASEPPGGAKLADLSCSAISALVGT